MPSAHSPLDLPSSSPPPPPRLQGEDENLDETKKASHTRHRSLQHASHKKEPQRRREEEAKEEGAATTQPQAPLKRGLSSPNPGMKRRRSFAAQSSSSLTPMGATGTSPHPSQEIHPHNHTEADQFHSPYEEKEKACQDDRRNAATSPLAPLDLPPLQTDGLTPSQRGDVSPLHPSSLKSRSSPFHSHQEKEEEEEKERQEIGDRHHEEENAVNMKKRRTSTTSGSFLQVSLPPVSPPLILTDWYQLAMLYANWREGRHLQNAVFEGFFRKAPFHGEYAVMAGVKQVIDFISHMRFTEDEIDFFRYTQQENKHNHDIHPNSNRSRSSHKHASFFSCWLSSLLRKGGGGGVNKRENKRENKIGVIGVDR